MIEEPKQYTLKQIIDRCKYLNELGYETWIEALPNRKVKIVIQEKVISILE